MDILGIETSCDETAAAVVSDSGNPLRPWIVRSNVVASQTDIHREWGGVVPEIASRQHIRDICRVVERAISDSGKNWSDIGAVAVTQGPGLVGSLLVGVSFAKSLAWSLGIRLVPVHHLAGHIESLVIEGGRMPLPAVVLVVSGGHTNLYRVTSGKNDQVDYQLIGRTRDDAAGEAYDKVATLLGLEYPGGPVIDLLAKQGNDQAVQFPFARMTHDDRNAGPMVDRPVGLAATHRYRLLEISFSGLSAEEVADICASFQRVVVDCLLDRTFRAARQYNARSIGIAGGVSANSRLRADATARANQEEVPLFLPSLSLATDNAAMIGAAGLKLYHAGSTASLDLNAQASLAM